MTKLEDLQVKIVTRNTRNPQPDANDKHAMSWQKSWRSNSPAFLAYNAEIWQMVDGFPCCTRRHLADIVEDGEVVETQLVREGTYMFPRVYGHKTIEGLDGFCVGAHLTQVKGERKWVIHLSCPMDMGDGKTQSFTYYFLEDVLLALDPEEFGVAYIRPGPPVEVPSRDISDERWKSFYIVEYYDSEGNDLYRCKTETGEPVTDENGDPVFRRVSDRSAVPISEVQSSKTRRESNVSTIPSEYGIPHVGSNIEACEMDWDENSPIYVDEKQPKRVPYEEHASNMLRRIRGTKAQKRRR